MTVTSIFDDDACEPRIEYRGTIVDEIEYYLGAAAYHFNRPSLDLNFSEIEFLRFFVLTLTIENNLTRVLGDPDA